MSDINTRIDPFTKSPNRLKPATFSADMDTRLAEENSRIAQMNDMSDEMNVVADELQVINTNVNNKNANVNTKALEVEADAQIAESAKNAILGYIIPTEATLNEQSIIDLDNLQNQVNFNAYGYTDRLSVEDRFLKTNTPNILRDAKGGKLRLFDRIVEISQNTDITMPLAPFDPTSNDSLSTTITLTVAKNYADIVVVESNDLIYQCISESAGTDLTNVSHYQTIPHVKTQDVILYRQSKTVLSSHGYHTFRGTKYFGAGYSSHDVMREYGYTQVDKNLWEDADYYYVFVSLRNTLNKKMYYFPYNTFGMYQNSSNQFWYQETTKATSLYEVFTRATNTTSGRPDGKTDLAYLEGESGLLPSGGNLPYAGKISGADLLEEEAQKLISGSGPEEGVETYEATLQTAGNFSGTSAEFVSAANPNRMVGDLIYHKSYLTGKRQLLIIDSIVSDTNYIVKGIYGEAIERSNNEYVNRFRKQPYLTTYKSSTTVELLGDPNNYPTDWKAYLASGKGIVGNALLVGQDGSDLIPDGTSKEFPFSKKLTATQLWLTTDTSGATWGSNTSVFDANFDTVTNKHNGASVTTLNRVTFFNYKSANAPLVQSDPLKIIHRGGISTFTNSHDIEKGNLLVYNVSGKVAVGNGVNPLESRLLENVILDSNGNIQTIPKHNGSILDGNSPAFKGCGHLALDEEGEKVLQVFAEEGVYNISGYGWATGENDEFEQLVSGTKLDFNSQTVQTKVLQTKLGVY